MSTCQGFIATFVLFTNWGKIQETSFKGLDYGNRYFQSNEEAFGGPAGFVLQITLASLEIPSCHRFFPVQLYRIYSFFVLSFNDFCLLFAGGRFGVVFLNAVHLSFGSFLTAKTVFIRSIYIQTIEADWGHIMIRDSTLAMICLLLWGRFLY